jgi:hypothetical protein
MSKILARFTKTIAVCTVVCSTIASEATRATAATLVNFEDLSLSSESFVRDSQGFTSQGAEFSNTFFRFDPDGLNLPVWLGWSYSNITDNTIEGSLSQVAGEFPVPNEFSAFPGSGADGSSNYGIAYSAEFIDGFDVTIDLPEGTRPVSAQVTNTTFTALVMQNGNTFPGGSTQPFDEDDFFKLSIFGLDNSGEVIGTTDFFLAENGEVVDTWEFVDLSGLTGATQLAFSLSSSDNDPEFGPNTPTYFALDNLVVKPIPEPATVISLILASTMGGLILKKKH